MHRLILSTLFTVCIAVSAAATPISLTDIRDELSKRGGSSLQVALMSGRPVISGYMQDQGFVLTMSDCHAGESVCQYLNFKTCYSPMDTTEAELLGWANDYNLIKSPGTAYVDSEIAIGAVICVKRDFDLSDERKFGITEAFEWNQTITKFTDHVDDKKRSKQARAIMGR